MTTLRSRPYAGPADLPGLLALWPACRPAAWQTDFPSPTDLAELLAVPEAAAHTQVWEDAAGRGHAYALVDDYDNLWFDRMPEVTGGTADEIVAWGHRLRPTSGRAIQRPGCPRHRLPCGRLWAHRPAPPELLHRAGGPHPAL